MPAIIVIAGPTGTQKSKLAIKLAQHINGVIVNGDSRQIYKELKIGTAQPIPDVIKKDIWYINDIPHYLYGFVSITQPYNLYKYQQTVYKLFKEITQPIIIVGGTGLYIDAVVQGYKLKEKSSDIQRRNELRSLSTTALQRLIPTNILKKLNNSDMHNPHRLIRIIEREDINREKAPLKHLYFKTVINSNSLYHKRLKRRIEKMFKIGLIEEVTDLVKKYPNLWELPAINTIGYKEFKDHFYPPHIPLEDVKLNIFQHTKQYAKRQKTWFQRNKKAKPIHTVEQLIQDTESFLKSF